MRRLWEDHSALIVSGLVTVAMSVVAWFLGIDGYVAEAKHLGEQPTIWPGYAQDYLYDWVISTLADAFGAFFIVWLFIRFQDRKSDAA